MVEEAERSLSPNMGEGTPGDGGEGGEIIDKDLERLESIKAAVISSAVGTLAGVPISSYQATSTTQLAAHLAVIFLSCALFGITFRYTVRRDLNNTQLKTGTCAAFGFIKGNPPFSANFSETVEWTGSGGPLKSPSVAAKLQGSRRSKLGGLGSSVA